MRKAFLNMTMTLDGFFCGPNGELDWMSQAPDQELNDDNVAFFQEIDDGFIGYPTASGMIPYWLNVAQNPSASKEERAIAQAVNRLHVFILSNREEKLATARGVRRRTYAVVSRSLAVSPPASSVPSPTVRLARISRTTWRADSLSAGVSMGTQSSTVLSPTVILFAASMAGAASGGGSRISAWYSSRPSPCSSPPLTMLCTL